MYAKFINEAIEDVFKSADIDKIYNDIKSNYTNSVELMKYLIENRQTTIINYAISQGLKPIFMLYTDSYGQPLYKADYKRWRKHIEFAQIVKAGGEYAEFFVNYKLVNIKTSEVFGKSYKIKWFLTKYADPKNLMNDYSTKIEILKSDIKDINYQLKVAKKYENINN